MNDEQITKLCRILDLGMPATRPRIISSGPPHRVWRLDVERGSLAVKELHRELLAQPGARHEYRQAESIAAQLAAEGVPTVVALTVEGDPLVDLDGATVLVYPWVAGVPLPLGALDAEQAGQLGEALGRIHAVNIQVPGLDRPGLRTFPPEHWLTLTRRALGLQLEWAGPARQAMDALLFLGDRYEAATGALARELLVSHRRLTPDNVLWIDRAWPWVIDWDAAGFINPAMEMVEVTLRWAGIELGAPQESLVRAMLDGYQLSGPTLETSGWAALAGCAGAWLSWLELGMLRSLNSELPANERALALTDVAVTLGVIEVLAARFEEWTVWFEPE